MIGLAAGGGRTQLNHLDLLVNNSYCFGAMLFL